MARNFIDSLYGATFDRDAATGLEAFMTSFSTHAADGAFEREHGVWSQWSEYAGHDGFCIVFDTQNMARLLGEEMDERYWAHLQLQQVRYGDAPLAELFPAFLKGYADTLNQFLDGTKYPEMAVLQFLEASTLLKEAKYRSERELRIVGLPGTQRMSAMALRDYPGEFKVLPLPEVRRRPGTEKRYVSVFEGKPVRLPIVRVIVGSAGGAEERARFARSLLPGVPVSISKSAPTD